jgi:hypothetical protein
LEPTYLGLTVGTPLLEGRRVSYDRASGEPYEYLVSLYSERVALTFEWLDAPRPPGRRPESP